MNELSGSPPEGTVKGHPPSYKVNPMTRHSFTLASRLILADMTCPGLRHIRLPFLGNEGHKTLGNWYT